MMKNLQILSILLLITYFPSNAQHVMILKPYGNMGNNAMIWTIYPDSNLVAWGELKMNSWTWDGTFGVERSLLYFNLNLIPANSTILSAKLSLYANDGNPENNSTIDGSNECLIQRITSSWDPTTVTWNTQPNSDTVHEAILPTSTGPYEDYLNRDITSLIQDLYNNPNIYKGLMIKLNTELGLRRMVFRSAYQPDSVKSPTLTINYSVMGIDEISAEDYFSVLPNPAAVNFSITRSSSINEASIEIHNALGVKIYFDKFSNGEKRKDIYLKDAVSGIYFIQIIDRGKQYCKKLLIK